MTGLLSDTTRADRRRLVGVLAFLGATNVVAHNVHVLPRYVVIPLAAILLLGLARLSGLHAGELGLGRRDLGRGLRWGAAVGLPVVCVVVVVSMLPGASSYFRDDRYSTLGEAVVAALVLIPFFTVLPEELMFRGVVHAAAQRFGGVTGAFVIGALAFGLWHVLTSLTLAPGNGGLEGLTGAGRFGQVLGVVGVVGVTSLAAVGLSWLRHRSGSVLAPICLHWALNGSGALAVGLTGHVTR